MIRTDSGLASLLLVNRLVDAGADPLSAKEYWRVVGDVQDPSRLLEMSPAEIADAAPGTDGERIRRLLDASTQLAFELERLAQSGIRVLSPFDEDYPSLFRQRLGTAAPPILHVVGPPDLLERQGLGVVGSRNIDAEGEAVAGEAARHAVRLGLPVVSGAARGTDMMAMAAAFDAGGSVVGILADPLDRKLRQPDIRRAIGEERLTLASPFKPDAGFSVASAMSRNKLVYALSTLTLVVASDRDKGGTWEGGKEALKRGYGRVAVWRGPGEGPGNAALADLGATVVSSVDALESLLRTDAPPEVTGSSGQLHLEI